MATHPIENFPDDDLDAFLAGEEPNWGEEPEPPPNQHEADKMLVRLSRLRRQRAASREAAEERIRQVVAWQAEREGVWLRQEEWLLGALRRYHEAVLMLNPSSTTIHLPSGDLRSRKVQPEWTIDDEALVLGSVLPDRARQRIDALRAEFVAAVGEVVGEAVAVEEAAVVVKVAPPGVLTVSKSGLKEYGTRRDEKGKPVAFGVAPSGESIPGVTVVKPGRKFDVALREAERTDDEAEWSDD